MQLSEQSLRTFCHTFPEEATKEIFLSPFNINEFSYATDKRILIRTEKIDGLPELDYEDIKTKILGYFTNVVNDGNFIALPEEPRAPHEKWGRVCSVCAGQIQTNLLRCQGCGDLLKLPMKLDCRECEGHGRERNPYGVKLGNTFVNAYYLVKLSRLENVRLAFSADPLDPITIAFHGGEGRLMPMQSEGWGEQE